MPLSYDLTSFLDSRAEICQILGGIFGKSKISKGHSEIIWPLVTSLLALLAARKVAAQMTTEIIECYHLR